MNKLLAGFVCASALVAGAAVPSGAQAIGFINGSFENSNVNVPNSPGFVTLGAGSTNITGWQVGFGAIDYIGSYWTAGDGIRSIDLNATVKGSIQQTITDLTIGQTYKVSFMLSGNPAGGPSTKEIEVKASVDSAIYQYDTAVEGTTLGDMQWVAKYFYFTATDDEAILKFESKIDGAYGGALDYVSVAATPLPAALPLFGSVLGAFGLFGWFRRRLTAAA